MPQTLSENPEEKVRQLLTDNWKPGNTRRYNPRISDPSDDDFLPIVTDWNSGDIYPIVSVTNNTPTVPGGGTTNVTGKQGSTGKNNQRRLETMQLTVQSTANVREAADSTSGTATDSTGVTSATATGGTATGGDADKLDSHEICELLYNEALRIVFDNQSAPNDAEVFNYFIAPPTHTVEKNDSDSFHQYAGDVTLHWNRTP